MAICSPYLPQCQPPAQVHNIYLSFGTAQFTGAAGYQGTYWSKNIKSRCPFLWYQLQKLYTAKKQGEKAHSHFMQDYHFRIKCEHKPTVLIKELGSLGPVSVSCVLLGSKMDQGLTSLLPQPARCLQTP